MAKNKDRAVIDALAEANLPEHVPSSDEIRSMLPAEHPVFVAPSEVKTVNSHIYQEPKLAFGECLVIALDANGNEYGEPFVTSIKTAEKHYTEPKFRIKKK